MDKKPLIILAGPTAVGKTNASIDLAKKVNGEIISADSMQVYQGMDIGSAKIKRSEMKGIKHYLIDTFPPDEPFSVAVFKEYALKAMEEIYAKGKIPIIVGGTGFYIQSILYDIEFSKVEGHKYRPQIETFFQEQGGKKLHQWLNDVDPVSAETIHENNVKRVTRALEYFLETGNLFSLHNAEQKAKYSTFNYAYFVLNDDRTILYERIEKRIDSMLLEGLVEEVKALLAKGYHKNLTAMEGLGYKEIIAYLEDEITLEEAIYLIKRDTRRFAKRQLTWFRREDDVIWINKKELNYQDDKILEYMLNRLKEKEIL